MSDDFYDLLGVDRSADERTLKKAYRKIAMECHPDRNPGDAQAEARFKSISEAYQVLSDPQKRQIYDRYGKEGLSQQGMGGGFSDIGDIFSNFGDIFGDLFGFGSQRGPRRGADLQTVVSLNLTETLRDAERTVEIPREEPCKPCNGSGAKAGTKPVGCQTCRGQGQVIVNRGFISMTTTCPDCRGEGQIIKERCKVCTGRGWNRSHEEVTVKIPAGVASGMKLRVTGKGKPSPQGGANGDLFVILDVEEHDLFQRVDNELLAEFHVPMVDACLGSELNFESLDGALLVTVEPGTQAGSIIRIPRRGMPDVSSGRRGDLHLRVQVDIPTSLSKKQRELLTAFKEA
ncbi:MAG: molecular chaperone DnaJ [Bradymonadia bacterium]